MGWFSKGKKEEVEEKGISSSSPDTATSLTAQLDSWRQAAYESATERTARAGQWIQTAADAHTAWRDVNEWTSLECMVMGSACVLSFGLGWQAASLRRSIRRLHTMMDVTSVHVGADAPLLKGRVVSVSDGDTLRLLHVPVRGWIYPTRLAEGDKLSDSTLQIRLCTIDTPETAKFGKPGQPFGEDAKKFLSDLVLDKMVQVRVLQKDQYGRGVGEIRYPGPILGFPVRYADAAMLKAGLAEVYQGSGAVYGRQGKDVYLRMQEEAKSQKKGMWALEDRESAAEYKARLKAEKE